MTPDQQQDRYDYILIARLRYPDWLEEAVQAELEAAGVDFSEEVSLADRLYALHSDNRELRRAVVGWHYSCHGEELTYEELVAAVEAAPEEWR